MNREALSAAEDESAPGLADLIDRLTQQVQAGEAVDFEACLRDHPQFAERLRRLLPAVQALADVGRSVGGSFAALAATPAPGSETLLGDYRILRTLGRGGMGVVYEAIQESLGRHVALKVLPVQGAVDPTYLERFKREAQAAARLHHTNIVPVFGAAEHQGVHYYAMQFIQGRGLDAILRERRQGRTEASTPHGSALVPRTPGRPDEADPTPVTLNLPAADQTPASGTAPRTGNSASRRGDQADNPARLGELKGQGYFRSAAHACMQVAEALDYAHRHGVLHRDIKPSNLLLDEEGVVWVADFGLAKVEGTGELTGSGTVVGTLRYMAPERFQGRSDPRSDVYSLGATLYELLTLRPIFEGDDPLELVRAITNEAPLRPRDLAPLLPRDLETIVQKATDRDPSGRYTTAGELAEDLRRYLADQPILARPLPWYERVGRWCRRNPALAVALGLALAASLAVALVSAVFAVHKSADAQEIAEQAQEIERKRDEAEAALAKEREVQRLKDLADERRREFERLSAGLALDRGLRLCARGQTSEGLLWLARGLEIYPGGDPELERALRANLGAWAPQLRPLLAHLDHAAPVSSITLSPDGRKLLTGTVSQQFRVWDSDSFAPVGPPFEMPGAQRGAPPLAVFSPDSRLVACRIPNRAEVQLIDALTGKPLGQPFRHTSNVIGFAFSPDAARLLVWGTLGQARLWDVTARRPIGPVIRLLGHRAVAAHFSGDGSRLLVASSMEFRRPQPGQPRTPETGFELAAFDTATGQPVGQRQVLAHEQVNQLAFLGDGKTLLSYGGLDTALRFWEMPGGKSVGEPIRTGMVNRGVVISPDGGLAALLHMNTVRLVALPGGKVLTEELPHGLHSLTSALFSPDGKVLVVTGTTAEGHSVASLWQVPECLPLCEPFVHEPGAALLAAFHPTKAALLLTRGQFLDCWGLESPAPQGVVLDRERVLSFAPGDARFLTQGADLTLSVRETNTGRLLAGPLKQPGGFSWAALSEDGKVLAVAGGMSVTVFDLTRQPPGERTVTPRDAQPPRCALSDDGRTLAIVTADHATLWDTASGKELGRTPSVRRGPLQAAFCPDNETLLMIAGSDLHRCHASTGTEAGPVESFPGLYIFAASADGRHVLTYREGLYETDLHDTGTGTTRRLPIVTPMRHAEFSRDGGTVMIACDSVVVSGTTIRQWDTATGQPRGRSVSVNLPGLTGLSPDGRVALTCGIRQSQGTLWHLPTGQPLGPPVRHAPKLNTVAFSRDGSHYSVGGLSSRLSGVPRPVEASVERVVLWCQVLTGMELGRDGEIGYLNRETWRERQRRLGELGGAPIPLARP